MICETSAIESYDKLKGKTFSKIIAAYKHEKKFETQNKKFDVLELD